MTAAVAVEALETTLRQLAPTMERLRCLLVEQRQALAAGDLQQILALTVEQEDTTARLAHLERRRQKIQADLEARYAVHGLTRLADLAGRDDDERTHLHALVVELRRQVVGLHQENERSAALLTAAIEVAQRTRTNLARLSGSQPAYSRPAVHRVTPIDQVGPA